jgi:DNA-binding transcriptional LysR family regulator
MNWSAISFDWGLVRAFLATVDEGSLSAASRALGQTQPTLSRQVNALEKALGVTLFERGPRTMALTEAGLALLEPARAMAQAAMNVSLSASGQSQAIDGQVSLTAGDMMSTFVLPGILRRLRNAAPGIDIEVLPSNDIRDLVRREADIAIRHVRPEGADLVARCVRDTSAHLYAARELIETMGRPHSAKHLSRYSFVGLSPVGRFMPTLQMHGLKVSAEQFKVTSSDGVALVALVREGLGLGILPRYAAETFEDLVPVLEDQFSVPIPIWLVTHRELHTSRRIRLVFDTLADALSRE